MAVNSTIILNNLHRTLVKVVADAAGSVTIPLADLAATAAGYSQTVSGTPVVSIIGGSLSSFDNGQYTTITRGGITVAILHGRYDIPADGVGQIKLQEGSTSDIVVTFQQAATLFLDLRKDDGYSFGPNIN